MADRQSKKAKRPARSHSDDSADEKRSTRTKDGSSDPDSSGGEERRVKIKASRKGKEETIGRTKPVSYLHICI